MPFPAITVTTPVEPEILINVSKGARVHIVGGVGAQTHRRIHICECGDDFGDRINLANPLVVRDIHVIVAVKRDSVSDGSASRRLRDHRRHPSPVHRCLRWWL